MSHPWLRHPPATLGRRPACPTDEPRFASRWLALAAKPGWHGNTRVEPADCDRCGGWHLLAAR